MSYLQWDILKQGEIWLTQGQIMQEIENKDLLLMAWTEHNLALLWVFHTAPVKHYKEAIY